jgi:predicted AAA+ superfamily ATPase
LEVDFILANGEVAVEVKGVARIDKRDLRSLNAFTEAYSTREAMIVCNEKEARLHGRILIMPWRAFLQQLWGGYILK